MDMVGGVQVDQALRKQIENLMHAEEMLDPAAFGTASAEDIQRFGEAVNYVNRPTGNMDLTMRNLQHTMDRLSGANQLHGVSHSQSDPVLGFGDTAETMRKQFESIPGTMNNLDVRVRELQGTPTGERLSDFVSVVKQRMERISNIVDEISKKPDLSQADMMKIQYEVMQMGIILDVASKVGDKGSQALQTLFRDK